ncbi:hypothetical protein ES332_D05G346000v1 [Gossypium tomentosum]|uniref:S-acyltransferase n=1 Tax=Gossypium tomentosum TaxID=34277 RepID=A0A5D2L3M5_GOSTO|nr:hypothetical protein ES332_D05G346000v1 [Gossypium tomentosum]
MAESGKQHLVTAVTEEKGTTCWGCGLRLPLPTLGPAFKCGWCGVITNHNLNKTQNQCLLWRRLRDRCFVSFLFSFMLFVISFPIIFLVSYTSGIVHSVITTILALTTISTFGLSAFQCAGAPPMILWGSYTLWGKVSLKTIPSAITVPSPNLREHITAVPVGCVYWIWIITVLLDLNCGRGRVFGRIAFIAVADITDAMRSLQIGNCVGAANHRHFIAFLISAIFSTIYVTVMSAYTSFLIWPPLRYKPPEHSTIFSTGLVMLASREGLVALLSSAMELPVRGLVLIYLFIASISVEISLSVLLWQQLCYIYEGRTYLSHLSSREGDHVKEKDCQNLLRFFGCRYSMLRFLPTLRNSRKRHKT